MATAARELVSTDWLDARIDAPDLVVLDASWHLPAEKRDAEAEFMERHIPGALFFDIDKIADPASPYPHMLPAPAMFSSRMRKMGIGDGARVVVYDSKGLFSAARVWWMFRVMGASDVAVLDGGLPKWLAEGRPTESGASRPRQPKHFTVRRDAGLVRERDDVLALLPPRGAGTAQLVDARSPGRFKGEEGEPRPGVRPGHIPGARNLPYATLLEADGRLKSPSGLAAAFAAAGVEPKQPIVASCGSGVTAAIVALAQSVLARPDAAIYDGSWAEWGSQAALPLETGPAKA